MLFRSEEMSCDDITSGAQSDIKQATMLSRGMIMEWGMGDEVGPINYSPDMGGDGYFGRFTPDYSQSTAEMIDREIKRLIDSAYVKVKDLIEANRDKLEAIAQALIKYETLDAEEVRTIIEGGQLEKPTVADLLAAEQKKAAGDNMNSAAKDTDWLLDEDDDDYDPRKG